MWQRKTITESIFSEMKRSRRSVGILDRFMPKNERGVHHAYMRQIYFLFGLISTRAAHYMEFQMPAQLQYMQHKKKNITKDEEEHLNCCISDSSPATSDWAISIVLLPLTPTTDLRFSNSDDGDSGGCKMLMEKMEINKCKLVVRQNSGL